MSQQKCKLNQLYSCNIDARKELEKKKLKEKKIQLR